MAEEGQRRALLGRQAGLGWFARRGEVAATQALAMLLEERRLREALSWRISERSRTRILGRLLRFSPSLSPTTALALIWRVMTFAVVRLSWWKRSSARS